MDAFFAAVEQLDNPVLRGKPVLVGSDDLRGVVATASYEARVFGCHSAQPMSIAKRLCPHAIVVGGRMSRYAEISDEVFAILQRFSPLIEPLSIDEAFLDLTGTERALGPAPDVARRLKATIFGELGLTASVGVAENKFLAKLASDMKKPNGLTVIAPEDVDQILPPMPATKIWGIGPHTAARLNDMAIRTIGDIRRASESTLSRLLGSDAARVRRLALGIDDREVVPDSRAKRIGHEQTFREDVADPQHVRDVLLGQVEQVAARLRRHNLHTKGIHLKIRFGDFKTITRAKTLDEPTDRTDELWIASREIFNAWAEKSFSPVRLIGMSAGSLADSREAVSLFTDPLDVRRRSLDRAVDSINRRFGSRTVRRGGSRD
jgi:DNA polymerase-4